MNKKRAARRTELLEEVLAQVQAMIDGGNPESDLGLMIDAAVEDALDQE